MAKRTRNKKGASARPPADGRRQPLSGQAKIWLTTVSTVLAVATGMFTLRDEIFHHPGVIALSPDAYHLQVGGVCNELNADDRRRVADWKTTKRRLERANTTIAQRNALLDGVHQTTARSDHALATFMALQTPKTLATAERETEAAWNRNLVRLRDYAQRLDRAGTRPQLFAAINYLSGLRSSLTRDGIKLTSGLDRLGGDSCNLRPPRVIPALTLPPLPNQQSGPGVGTTPSAVVTPGPTPTSTTPSDVVTPGPTNTTPTTTGTGSGTTGDSG